jgi:hypothetical protein
VIITGTQQQQTVQLQFLKQRIIIKQANNQHNINLQSYLIACVKRVSISISILGEVIQPKLKPKLCRVRRSVRAYLRALDNFILHLQQCG